MFLFWLFGVMVLIVCVWIMIDQARAEKVNCPKCGKRFALIKGSHKCPKCRTRITRTKDGELTM